MGLIRWLRGDNGGGHQAASYQPTIPNPAPKRVGYATKVATPPNAVARDDKSLMQKRGWVQKGNSFNGPYATRFGTWHGSIVRAGDRTRVQIKNPPMQFIDRHPKRACFHGGYGGWWTINLHTEPCDGSVDAIVAYVERVLIEAKKITEGSNTNVAR